MQARHLILLECRRIVFLLAKLLVGRDSQRFLSVRGFPRRQVLDFWCCRTGLNCRPLPYQGSALPLSYGSGGCGRLARERGGNCHKGPTFARIEAAVGGHFADFPDRAALARRGPLPLRENMTTPKQELPPRPARKPSRAERLAAELRANLRRRKAQAAGAEYGGKAFIRREIAAGIAGPRNQTRTFAVIGPCDLLSGA